MKPHDIAALFNRAAAALETPADLNTLDVMDLVADLNAAADELDPPQPKPPYYLAKIEILIAVDHEAGACDSLSETLRPLLREFDPQSCVIDWRYSDQQSVPEPHDGKGFEYVDHTP